MATASEGALEERKIKPASAKFETHVSGDEALRLALLAALPRPRPVANTLRTVREWPV